MNSPLASGTHMSTKSVTDHKKQEQLDSAPGKVLMCLLSLLLYLLSLASQSSSHCLVM